MRAGSVGSAMRSGTPAAAAAASTGRPCLPPLAPACHPSARQPPLQQHLPLPVHKCRLQRLSVQASSPSSSAFFAAAAAQQPPAPAPPPAEASTPIQPDLVLHAPGLKRKVQVFGVQHTSSASALGEYILRAKPAAVIVETAVTPEHGARPGNRITCQDRLIEGPAAFYMRVFCKVAGKMAEEAAQLGGDFTATNMWQQARSGAFRGEQLVYVAALACGAPLVFGDRPKDITYRRLYTLASAADLDQGYGRQAAINYLEMLGRPPLPASDLDEASTVERISMQEREAVMCSTAHEIAMADSQAAEGQQQDVVMVVGSAHLSGLEKLWADAKWRVLLDSEHAHDSPIMRSPPLESVQSKEVGLRRGLLTSLLRMSATREVLVDLEHTLGAVPQQQQQAFQAVCEVYGSTRTMLACLDRPLLNEVCQGRKDDGQQADLWTLLSPVRAIRPSQGGPGYSEEMVTFIRGLNFDLD